MRHGDSLALFGARQKGARPVTHVDIIVSTSPTPEMYNAIVEPLVAYNTRAGGPSGREVIALMLQDQETGEHIGGLWGRFGYDWLFVELLVVPETLRGKGYGVRLMQDAERIARQRGAAGIWLDTFNFQARGFYEKLGFSVFGELPDHPHGGARYFMRKVLDDTGLEIGSNR